MVDWCRYHLTHLPRFGQRVILIPFDSSAPLRPACFIVLYLYSCWSATSFRKWNKKWVLIIQYGEEFFSFGWRHPRHGSLRVHSSADDIPGTARSEFTALLTTSHARFAQCSQLCWRHPMHGSLSVHSSAEDIPCTARSEFPALLTTSHARLAQSSELVRAARNFSAVLICLCMRDGCCCLPYHCHAGNNLYMHGKCS